MKTETPLRLTDLANFTGTHGYHRHWLGILYTDGIAHMAEHGGRGNGAYWIIDAIASHWKTDARLQTQEMRSFQLWTLAVDLEKKCAVLECRADSDTPVIVRQQIEYSDFEIELTKFYVCEGVLMLPSEY